MDKKIYIVGILAIILIVGGMFLSKNQKEESAKKDENKKVEVKKIEIKENKEEKKMNEENKETNTNIITTDSGLQYEIIKMGDGPKPTATDTVEVHYHGTLEDGSVFDSSVERGEKISFPLNGVIAGWTEGLQLMPVGSKFKFIIPPELAYGPTGSGHPLAGKTLIFEVELFDIK